MNRSSNAPRLGSRTADGCMIAALLSGAAMAETACQDRRDAIEPAIGVACRQAGIRTI
jgi:hypothetical protein